MITRSLCAALSFWAATAVAVDPVPVYKYGNNYYATFAEAELAMRDEVPSGADLAFKTLVPQTDGSERYIYNFPPTQFTRVSPEFYKQGTFAVESSSPVYYLKPIEVPRWDGRCSSESKPTFVYQEQAGRSEIYVFNSTSVLSPPVPGHMEYVKEEHKWSVVSFTFDGKSCIASADRRTYGNVLMLQAVRCRVGYKPRGVVVSGVPFRDVCVAIDWHDYSIYKEMAACSVSPLTPIEQIPPNDADSLARTLALERGEGGYSLLTPEMKEAEQCLARKFATKVVCYEITSDYRSMAYQKHLREIWDKWHALKALKTQKEKTACRAIATEINAEMGATSGQPLNMSCTLVGGRNHCLRAKPAQANPKHAEGNAIDVNLKCVRSLESALRECDELDMIKGLLEQPAKCNLIWGGDFTDADPVHFNYSSP